MPVESDINIIRHFRIIGVHLSRETRGYEMTAVLLRAHNDPSSRVNLGRNNCVPVRDRWCHPTVPNPVFHNFAIWRATCIETPQDRGETIVTRPGERRRQSRADVRGNRKLGFPSVTSRRPCDFPFVCETSGSRTWSCPFDNMERACDPVNCASSIQIETEFDKTLSSPCPCTLPITCRISNETWSCRGSNGQHKFGACINISLDWIIQPSLTYIYLNQEHSLRSIKLIIDGRKNDLKLSILLVFNRFYNRLFRTFINNLYV